MPHDLDIKMSGLVRKAGLVTGGHTTDIPCLITYSSVVSVITNAIWQSTTRAFVWMKNNNVQIKKIIAGLNQPEWGQTHLCCCYRLPSVRRGTLGCLCWVRPRTLQHAPRPGDPQGHEGWINGQGPKVHRETYGKGPLEVVLTRNRRAYVPFDNIEE